VVQSDKGRFCPTTGSSCSAVEAADKAVVTTKTLPARTARLCAVGVMGASLSEEDLVSDKEANFGVWAMVLDLMFLRFGVGFYCGVCEV